VAGPDQRAVMHVFSALSFQPLFSPFSPFSPCMEFVGVWIL
jgi:hypothetical protein